MNKDIFAGDSSEGFALTDGELTKALGGSGTSDVPSVSNTTGFVGTGITSLGGWLGTSINSLDGLAAGDATSLGSDAAGVLGNRVG